MAKKLVKWTRDENILKISKYAEGTDKNTPIIIEAEFNLEDLQKVMHENVEFELLCVEYLAKQKLSDSGASAVGDVETKIGGAKKRWEELLEAKWTGERANATGAAENKKLLASVKETAKVVSLEGLIVKKTLYPGTFTEEDAAKLQELMEAEVKINGKKGKN